MADLSPGGAVVSFAGVALATLSGVADRGYPSIDRQPVEAYESLLGLALPVDLFNGASAPRKDLLTCDVLIRAADDLTDPAAAWAAVIAGYRALAGLPETGTLVAYSTGLSGATVSCQARRKPLPLALSQSNARFYKATLTFTLTTDWVSG